MKKELSPKIQSTLKLLQSNYKKTEVSKGDIYVFDGSIMHVIEEKNNEIKISSTLNMRYWVLLSLLIIFGILLGFVGVILVIVVAKFSTIKKRKAKKAKLITLLN